MLAYLACFITTVGSAVYLWKKSRWWDLVAYASAEIGAVFTGITLVTGMLWGRPTWGVYWVWDARLTSTAMLFLLLLGYLAVRRIPAAAPVRSKRSAIVGLLLVPNVIIVRQSVEWWRTLHQEATLFANGLESEIHGLMLFAWFVGVVVFGVIFAWLLIHRFRLAWLQEQIEEHGLERAIADRRAEADAEAEISGAAEAADPSPTEPGTDSNGEAAR
jgi:heme exporter protein C